MPQTINGTFKCSLSFYCVLSSDRCRSAWAVFKSSGGRAHSHHRCVHFSYTALNFWVSAETTQSNKHATIFCSATGLLQVVKQYVKIPVYVMIRPRGGDFLYSDQEVEVMRKDIELMKSYGADGLVLGALTEDGRVDAELCMELLGSVHIWSDIEEITSKDLINIKEMSCNDGYQVLCYSIIQRLQNTHNRCSQLIHLLHYGVYSTIVSFFILHPWLRFVLLVSLLFWLLPFVD